jgi:pectate lyase
MVYNYVLSGWGKVGNVTGGTGGTVHEFTNIETMRLFCIDNPSTPMILIYTGSDFAYSVDQRYDWSTDTNPVSNKTLYASAGQKIIKGQWWFTGATNFIVRNFRRAVSFNDLMTWRFATRIWIDHCEFDGEATSADNYVSGTTVDGCCDITKESDLITISNTLFLNGTYKTMLVGSSNLDVQDQGKLRVTLDRVLFKNCRGRTPFVRFSPFFHKINVLQDWDVLPTFFALHQEVGIEARILTERCYFKKGRYMYRDYAAEAGEVEISGIKSIDSTIGELSATSDGATGKIGEQIRPENVDFDITTEPDYTYNALNTTQELEDWIAEWGGAKYHLIPSEEPQTLTVTTTTGGTVSQDPLGASFTAGTSITLTATASEGFVFSRYRNTANNVTLSTNSNYTFNMPSNNLSIEAVFVADTPPSNGKKFIARKRNNL